MNNFLTKVSKIKIPNWGHALILLLVLGFSVWAATMGMVLVDSSGNYVGTAGNPLYVSAGATANFTDISATGNVSYGTSSGYLFTNGNPIVYGPNASGNYPWMYSSGSGADGYGEHLYIDTYDPNANVQFNLTGVINMLLGSDTDDYLTFATTSNVPTMGTVGGCDLKITSDSGTVDFDNDLIYNTGGYTTTSTIWNKNDAEIQQGNAREYRYMCDTNGAGSTIWTRHSALVDGVAGSRSGAILYTVENAANGIADFDAFDELTLILTNHNGADANDIAYSYFGPGDSSAVTSAWPFYLGAAGTGALDGVVDATTTEVGPYYYIGVPGSSPTISMSAGDLLLAGDVEILGNLTVGGGILNPTVFKDYSFLSPSGGSGFYFVGGYYSYSAADANLNQGSTTVNIGNANAAEGAHAFIVSGGNGSTDGSDLVLTVSGTSITDGATRTPADSEVIVADCTNSAADTYYETSKKWLGVVTFTLSSTAGTTFNYDFNYGLAKYEDMGNNDFTVTDFEIVGRAGASDSSFDVTLYYHSATGWTYSAAAFAPDPTIICNLQTDYNTEYQLVSGEYFAYKRSGLSTAVTGSGSEGVVIKIDTGANGAVDISDIHVGFNY